MQTATVNSPSSSNSVTTPRSPFVLHSYGLSDPGLHRESNEDRFAIAELARTLKVHQSNLPPSNLSLSLHRAYVFLIADGVGGSNAGEIASGLSVSTIEDFLLNTLRRFSNLQASEEQAALQALQEALCQADAYLRAESANHPQWQGMATTLTLAFAANWRLFVAHVGDSRCYLYSGGKLQQITQDHTLAAELARCGAITAAEAQRHPWRHVVTNILGGKTPGVSVELHCLDLHADDTLLLCSDGLTDMVPETQIAELLQAEHDPQRACERLIEEAKGSGGKDNITVIVTRVQPTPTSNA